MIDLTPAAVRAARALLLWTQNDLAKAVGTSARVINAFEKSRDRNRDPLVQAALFERISEAFAEAGVDVIADRETPGATFKPRRYREQPKKPSGKQAP